MMSKVISGLLASSAFAALPADIASVQINGVNGKPIAMPLVGMGTWTDSESVAESSVKLAFSAGYRHVDTALVYANQDAVGRALKASQVPRDEYFITSKVPPSNATATAQNLDACMSQLGLEYVDLMLIHYNDPNISSKTLRQEQWLEMEKWAKAGKARALGVSHYCKTHIEDILEVATVPIAVDQVQYHVGMGVSAPDANDDKAFVRSQGIVSQSFSPLCGPCNPPDNKELLTGELVTDIGNAHNKTGAQVALKWLVQQGIPVIPRSNNAAHVKENMDLFDFELSADEMYRLSTATSPAAAGGPGPQDSGDCSIAQELVV